METYPFPGIVFPGTVAKIPLIHQTFSHILKLYWMSRWRAEAWIWRREAVQLLRTLCRRGLRVCRWLHRVVAAYKRQRHARVPVHCAPQSRLRPLCHRRLEGTLPRDRGFLHGRVVQGLGSKLIYFMTYLVPRIVQGDTSPGESGLGWPWFWLVPSLPGSAWAYGKLAELAEQLSKMEGHPKSKSTQPRYARRWTFMMSNTRSNTTWRSVKWGRNGTYVVIEYFRNIYL